MNHARRGFIGSIDKCSDEVPGLRWPVAALLHAIAVYFREFFRLEKSQAGIGRSDQITVRKDAR